MNALIVIAASAGGLGPIREIVAALPPTCSASIFIVVHIGPHSSALPDLLAFRSNLPTSFAVDGAPIEPGHIYVAPPDRHVILEPGRMRLYCGPKVHYTRPAADPLFTSAAEAYGSKVIGIVLSGGGKDGAAGLRAIRGHGGSAIVQDPSDAKVPDMPLCAIAADHADAWLPAAEIARVVCRLCGDDDAPSVKFLN